MIEFKLTCGRITTVDDEDAHFLSLHAWHSQKAHDTHYVAYAPRGKKVYLHRLIAGSQKGEITDHRDGNGLNNCRSNLRRCTNAQNMFNQRKLGGATSKYKGVSWYKRGCKWRAYIVLGNKQVHLGYFDDEIEAANVYDSKAIELFGEFACLNFPKEAA